MSAAAAVYWPKQWRKKARPFLASIWPISRLTSRACMRSIRTRHVEYRECAAETLATECPASFDVVTCMEMLEHVPDPAQTVQACANLTKPGGWVFFSTINRNAEGVCAGDCRRGVRFESAAARHA